MKSHLIVCLEEKSREGSLLFWKEGGKGYTSDISEAGRFGVKSAEEVNRNGRDVALTTRQLENIPFMKIYCIADCPLNELVEFKTDASSPESNQEVKQ